MIFGRPGSGKSTFATYLAKNLNLPLHHLDKHFYEKDWVERNYNEFLEIQQNIVNSDRWIVDGNNTRSLETRWKRADLVLYFNFPKIICYLNILKRFFRPNKTFDDRAPGCYETIRLPLLKYIWSFEKRVSQQITPFKENYPNTLFKEIKNKEALNQINQDLLEKL